MKVMMVVSALLYVVSPHIHLHVPILVIRNSFIVQRIFVCSSLLFCWLIYFKENVSSVSLKAWFLLERLKILVLLNLFKVTDLLSITIGKVTSFVVIYFINSPLIGNITKHFFSFVFFTVLPRNKFCQ